MRNQIMISTLRRAIFYGAVMLLCMLVFFKVGISIPGEHAYKIFLVFSLISGVTQSINALIIKKIEDVEKSKIAGFWPKIRLQLKVSARREIAFARGVSGILFALLTGAFSAYMGILDKSYVPYWLLGLATGTTLISMAILFLTFFELYRLAKLESELSRKNNQKESKSAALAEIRGEHKNES